MVMNSSEPDAPDLPPVRFSAFRDAQPPSHARFVNSSMVQCESNAKKTPAQNGERKVACSGHAFEQMVHVRKYPSKPETNANKKCADRQPTVYANVYSAIFLVPRPSSVSARLLVSIRNDDYIGLVGVSVRPPCIRAVASFETVAVFHSICFSSRMELIPMAITPRALSRDARRHRYSQSQQVRCRPPLSHEPSTHALDAGPVLLLGLERKVAHQPDVEPFRVPLLQHFPMLQNVPSNLFPHERLAVARRLVIELDAVAREHVVAFSVLSCNKCLNAPVLT